MSWCFFAVDIRLDSYVTISSACNISFCAVELISRLSCHKSKIRKSRRMQRFINEHHLPTWNKFYSLKFSWNELKLNLKGKNICVLFKLLKTLRTELDWTGGQGIRRRRCRVPFPLFIFIWIFSILFLIVLCPFPFPPLSFLYAELFSSHIVFCFK